MPKKPNETDLEYKRRVIDIKSESFCGAKWYNATIWLGSGQTTSCHHPLPHQIDIHAVEDNPRLIHNTPEKKEQRRQMQVGERPAGCEYCWKIEDMGTDKISDRVDKTRIYTDEELDEAYNTDYTQDVNLRTLEIAFDRTCQLACSYCNPAFSSTWVKDIRNNGPYNNLVSDGRNHFTHRHDSSQLFTIHDRNPYVEAFFKWWESDLHKTLTELRITGGEPLMSGYTWKLLDWFKANKGKSQTRLAINSNLAMEQDKIDRLLEAAGDVELDLYTSCEATYDHAEYIRDGLDYTQWLDNVEYLLKSKKLRGLHVMCTVNSLCLLSLPYLLKQIVRFKKEYGQDSINFTLNILRFPSFQSPLVLDKEFRRAQANRLGIFKTNYGSELHEFEINHIERLIDYLELVDKPHSDAFEEQKLLSDFKNFYEQYDERRNKNFTETFPELESWYNGI
jgi:pyruvate-formate lyase-activating enzyme